MPLGEGQRGGRRKRGRAFQLLQLSAVIPPTLSHPSFASGQASPLLSADPSGARLTDGSSIPAPPQAICDSAAGAGQGRASLQEASVRWDPTRVFLDMWRAGRQERGAVKSRSGVRRLTF